MNFVYKDAAYKYNKISLVLLILSLITNRPYSMHIDGIIYLIPTI